MAADAARLKELFLAAAAAPSPAERAALLDRACGADAELRQRVEALLRAHDDPGGFLAQEAAAPGVTADDAPLAEPEAVGTCVGPYKLLQKLGEGGMGAVWVAEQHEPVRRRVALKLIKPGMDSAQVVRRFAAERQALALMDHTNIAKVFDAGTTAGGRPYFVMELVHGVPLTKYCDELNLPVRERLALFVPVCRAVQHAHQKGILHRDLKPSNVLVAMQDGRPVPKVIDFGVAKALHQRLAEGTVWTGFGAVVGTLEYMSPEQAEVSPLGVDTRSDVYALGVLLYELLTGTTPLTRRRLKEAGLAEVVRLIKDEEPPRPSTRLTESRETLAGVAAHRRSEPGRLMKEVRGELDWIAMRCLEKDRTRRYETASGLARDVERYLADEPVEACPPSAAYRLRKLARKHRGALAAVAACALLLAAGTVASTWQAVRATRAEREADRKRGEAQAAAAAEKKARQAEAAERRRAEKAEKLAKDRLADVTREKQRAQAVSKFLREDLLGQADSRAQVEGGFTADPNLTVKQALDRAAAKIGDRFRRQPLEEAAVRQTIGDAYQGIGAPRLALPHLQRALALRGEHLGPGHLLTLDVMASLAHAYKNDGQLRKALSLYERVLAGDSKRVGPDHLLTLANMSNLAEAYQEAGLLKESLDLFEKVMAKHRKAGRVGQRETVGVMISMALAYQEAGRLKEALPLSRQSLDLVTKFEGADHPHTLTAMNNLGLAYQRAGQPDQALPLLQRTLKRCKERLGPGHPQTLTALHNLGLVYADKGDRDKAVQSLKEALAGRQAKLGPDHSLTLESMVSLAVAYGHAGQPDKARGLLEQALAKCRKHLGPDHRSTLFAMARLAVAYRQAGQPKRAVQLLEEAVAKMKDRPGPDHPNTLVAMQNLGVAYQSAGHPDKAVRLLEPALPRMKDEPGADHPGTLAAMISLAGAYEQVGRQNEALTLLEQALPRCKEKLRPDHPLTLLCLNNLAWLCWQMKKWDRSIPLFKEELERRTRTQGANYPETMRALANLAATYRDARRPQDSIRCLEQLLTTLRKLPDPIRAEWAWVPEALADTYYQAGQPAKAEQLSREFLEQARRRFGPDDPRTADRMARLGSNPLRQKKYADAEPVLRDCLAIRAKKLPDHALTFNTKVLLGEALLGRKKYKEAEPLLKDGYEGMKKRAAQIPPQGKVRLVEALERLVQLYEATDRKDEAARWRAERAKYPKRAPREKK